MVKYKVCAVTFDFTDNHQAEKLISVKTHVLKKTPCQQQEKCP